MNTMPKNLYDCLEHPKTCAPDDFWGQVRRTVNGKPVPQEQIDMMVEMIRQGLELTSEDVLLDLCCGNGALSYPLFDEVREYLGVDISPYLIEIANKNFKKDESHTFKQQTAYDFCVNETIPERFTKMLWFSAFSYFSPTEVKELLGSIEKRFVNIQRLFIGSIPNKDNANAFFKGNQQLDLDDHTTAIGRWYSHDNFCDIVRECGWTPDVLPSLTGFYQAHYRFNAILTR